MRPVPELLDDELARLVRARLEARQPRRLPERFVPPSGRPWPARVAVAAIMAGLALMVLAGLEATRPDLGPAAREGHGFRLAAQLVHRESCGYRDQMTGRMA